MINYLCTFHPYWYSWWYCWPLSYPQRKTKQGICGTAYGEFNFVDGVGATPHPFTFLSLD